MLYNQPPARESQWALSQIHEHRHNPGDIVAYFHVTRLKKKGKSFQFSKVRILRCAYDKIRQPRYEIEILNRLTVRGGQVITEYDPKKIRPTAYSLDRNCFPVEEWDEQIQRKLNLTKALGKSIKFD